MNKTDYKSINSSQPFKDQKHFFTEPHQEKFYVKKVDKKHLHDTIKKKEKHSEEKNTAAKKLVKVRPLRTENCEYYNSKTKNNRGHVKHNFSTFQQRSPLHAFNSNFHSDKIFNTYSQYVEPLEQYDPTRKLLTHTSQSFNETYAVVKQANHLSNICQIKNTEDDEKGVKRSNERSSKSKKKIHFTVYQNRSNSNSLNKYQGSDQVASKQTLQNKIQKKNNYHVPYRHNNSITINLFPSNGEKTPIVNRPSATKSTKSLTKQQHSQKKQSINRVLPKLKQQIQRDEAIYNTLLKLQNFKFVYEYLTKSEIVDMITNFRLAGELECKWVLLIIDGVFKNRNEEGSFEKYVSK